MKLEQILSVGIAIFALPLAAQVPDIGIGGAFGELRVIVPAPAEQRYHHLSWPKAVTANDGTIVTAYIAGSYQINPPFHSIRQAHHG